MTQRNNGDYTNTWKLSHMFLPSHDSFFPLLYNTSGRAIQRKFEKKQIRAPDVAKRK